MYLGGNEQSTHKYVSDLLGKATIDTNTYGKSTGHSGNYSTNYQNTGRELMTPDEVRMLDNDKAILFIRGERPILDQKYDITGHPRFKDSAQGNGRSFLHGEISESIGEICLTDSICEAKEISTQEEYIVLDAEEIKEILKEQRKGGK